METVCNPEDFWTTLNEWVRQGLDLIEVYQYPSGSSGNTLATFLDLENDCHKKLFWSKNL